MSLFNDNHRDLQDAFDSRALADRLEQMIVLTSINETDAAFIESRQFFFLSSVDHEGQPTVSFKGGATGFVKVIDETTIAFPSYDGNGMYYSLGNMRGDDKIGILFLDFEKPHRIRFHGKASVDANDPLLAEYPEAQLIVRVSLTKMWVNCPRYIPILTKQADSKFVPDEAKSTPLPAWKRIDAMQDVLPKNDQALVANGPGVIKAEDYPDALEDDKAPS